MRRREQRRRARRAPSGAGAVRARNGGAPVCGRNTAQPARRRGGAAPVVYDVVLLATKAAAAIGAVQLLHLVLAKIRALRVIVDRAALLGPRFHSSDLAIPAAAAATAAATAVVTSSIAEFLAASKRRKPQVT